MIKNTPIIGLVGNPNAGKSTIFNILTGLTQKVGNFPGVTVEKKYGKTKLESVEVEVIDFPGLYSLFPITQDEKIVVEALINLQNDKIPNLLIYVMDACQVQKHFLLLSQLLDLKIPMVVAVNMIDLAEEKGIVINFAELTKATGLPFVPISGRTNFGINTLKKTVQHQLERTDTEMVSQYQLGHIEEIAADQIAKKLKLDNLYKAKLIGHHYEWLSGLNFTDRQFINEICNINGFGNLQIQIQETLTRYEFFSPIVKKAVIENVGNKVSVTDQIDKVVSSPVSGPLVFFGILFLIFQSVFQWSSIPMDWIDTWFGYTGEWLKSRLPLHWISDVFVEGIWAGIGGIMVFVPQIFSLFFLVSILEDTGYMARAVYMFDRIMQRFGMNGRSIVALISGGACAIPAIMSTRTILNWKERLITILVTPLISCSARIPVYTVLIGLCIPEKMIFGYLSFKGIVFFSIYLVGTLVTLIVAMILNRLIKSRERSFLMIEMPEYKWPSMRNILLNVKEKVMSYVFEAGKVILVIAVLLWFMATYGPKDSMKNAIENARIEAKERKLAPEEAMALENAYKIESSFAGILGKSMEPIIKPLGYDWKIGIALICSFAAREVFVGTMATIYSIENQDDTKTMSERLSSATDPRTGRKIYSLATCMSLITFYTFALQCMSTMAVTRKETYSWKWPILQFLIFGMMAYLFSWIVFSLFS